MNTITMPNGETATRTDKRHFTHALVWRDLAGRHSAVSWSGSEALCRKEARKWIQPTRPNTRRAAACGIPVARDFAIPATPGTYWIVEVGTDHATLIADIPA